MSFFKVLGKLACGITEVASQVAGTVLGEGTKLVGEIVESEFIKEIGDSVYNVTTNAGKTVGQVVDGAGTFIDGAISGDKRDMEEGFNNIGGAVLRTGAGIVKGIGHVAESGVETLDGLLNGDDEKAMKSAKKLVKVVAVSAIAIGVADQLDIIEGTEDIDLAEVDDEYYAGNVEVLEEPGVHEVEPHHVEGYIREDGTVVEDYWRDGDGNPNTMLSSENGGYLRSNPDGYEGNNIG